MTEIDPDSIVAVARKDFRDAIRSRGLLLLTAVFVVFFAVAAYVSADAVQQQLQTIANSQNASQAQAAKRAQQRLTSDAFLQSLTQVTRLLIPLTGIVVAYASVVGERESGTLKLLLSLPHSRLDIVLGKLGGRSAVVVVPVLLGFLVAAPVFPLLDVPFKPLHFVAFALATALIGVVFVALSIGISAAASTSRKAVVAIVTPYAVFTLLWGQLSTSIATKLVEGYAELFNEELAGKATVELFVAVRHLNPIATYKSLVSSIQFTSAAQARASLFPQRQAFIIAQQLGDVPIYLTDGALVIYLLLWIAVPVALGYWAFERADL